MQEIKSFSLTGNPAFCFLWQGCVNKYNPLVFQPKSLLYRKLQKTIRNDENSKRFKYE